MDYLTESGKHESRDAHSHGLSDLRGAFYLLLCGLALSLITLGIEIVWFKINSLSSIKNEPQSEFQWID